MGAYYFDSSALVKRYADETGSLWVRSLTDPEAGHNIFTAHEATTAISTFKSHFQTQYQIVRMTTEIVERAMELAEQHRLRGYDATQLASALVVHAELAASGVSQFSFISADTDLNDVAQAEQLSVQNPNDYP